MVDGWTMLLLSHVNLTMVVKMPPKRPMDVALLTLYCCRLAPTVAFTRCVLQPLPSTPSSGTCTAKAVLRVRNMVYLVHPNQLR